MALRIFMVTQRSTRILECNAKQRTQRWKKRNTENSLVRYSNWLLIDIQPLNFIGIRIISSYSQPHSPYTVRGIGNASPIFWYGIYSIRNDKKHNNHYLILYYSHIKFKEFVWCHFIKVSFQLSNIVYDSSI